MEHKRLALTMDSYERSLKRYGIISSEFKSILAGHLDPVSRKRQLCCVFFYLFALVQFSTCFAAILLKNESLRRISGEFLSHLPVVGVYVQALYVIGGLYPAFLSPIMFLSESRNDVAFFTDFRSSNVDGLQVTEQQCKQLNLLFKIAILAHKIYRYCFSNGEVALQLLAFCMMVRQLESWSGMQTVPLFISLCINVIYTSKYHSFLVFNFASACISTKYASMRTKSLVQEMRLSLLHDSRRRVSQNDVKIFMSNYLSIADGVSRHNQSVKWILLSLMIVMVPFASMSVSIMFMETEQLFFKVLTAAVSCGITFSLLIGMAYIGSVYSNTDQPYQLFNSFQCQMKIKLDLQTKVQLNRLIKGIASKKQAIGFTCGDIVMYDVSIVASFFSWIASLILLFLTES